MTKDNRLNERELLVERLRREIWIQCLAASNGIATTLVNPDGPASADAITELTDELAAAHARIAELEDTLIKGPELKQVGPNAWAARIRLDADTSKPLTMEQEIIIYAALTSRNNPDE